MRFHVANPRLHRRVTKSLAKALRGAGLDIGMTSVADLAARLYGYADRHELDACAGRVPQSAWDEDEAPGVVAARRDRQVAVLISAGLGTEAAGRVLEAVRPTSRGKPAPSNPTANIPTADTPVSGTGIEELLDAWDTPAGFTPDAVFGSIVTRAYRYGASGMTLRPDRTSGCEFVTVSKTRTVLHRCDRILGMAIKAWALSHADGLIRVHSGGRDIRVIVSADGEDTTLEAVFLDTIRTPPPISAYGIPAHETWLETLLTRPGFHVLCSDWGFGQMAETLGMEFARLGIPSEDHGRRPRSDGLVPRARVVERDSAFRTLAPMDYQDGHGTVIVLAGPADGRQATPEGFVRDMLLRGFDPDFIRCNLVSTGTRIDLPGVSGISPGGWEGGMDSMRWDVTIRQPPSTGIVRDLRRSREDAWNALKMGRISAGDYQKVLSRSGF